MSNKVLKGTLYLSIAQALFMLSGYITNIWLGRYLGPALYGIYGVLTSLITALNIMQVSGVPQATSRLIAQTPDSKDSILKSALKIQIVTTVLFSILFFLSAPFISSLFNYEGLKQYIFIAAFVFPSYGLLALYGGFYNGLHQFGRQSFINSIYSISKVVAIIGLTVLFALKGAIIGFVIAPIVALSFAIYIPKSKKNYPINTILKISAPLVCFALLHTLQFSIDLFVLRTIEIDNNQIGYYVAAQNIALIIFMTLSAVGLVLFPNVARLKNINQNEKLRNLITKSVYYALIIILPVAALFISTSAGLIKTLYGVDYLSSTSPLSLLVIGYVFLSLFAILSNILNGSGHTVRSIRFALIGVLTTIILSAILIPKHGLLGAAIGSLVGAMISAIASYFAVRNIFNVKIFNLKLLFVFTYSSFIVLIGIKLNLSSIVATFSYWIVITVITAILYFAVPILKKDEIKLVSGIFNRYIKSRANRT